MTHLTKVGLFLALTLLFATAAQGRDATQTDGTYDLSWYTVDGGGGMSSGGGYGLSGSIGQPLAGAVNGGDYELCAGYWCGVVGEPYTAVYLPIILR